ERTICAEKWRRVRRRRPTRRMDSQLEGFGIEGHSGKYDMPHMELEQVDKAIGAVLQQTKHRADFVSVIKVVIRGESAVVIVAIAGCGDVVRPGIAKLQRGITMAHPVLRGLIDAIQADSRAAGQRRSGGRVDHGPATITGLVWVRQDYTRKMSIRMM